MRDSPTVRIQRNVRGHTIPPNIPKRAKQRTQGTSNSAPSSFRSQGKQISPSRGPHLTELRANPHGAQRIGSKPLLDVHQLPQRHYAPITATNRRQGTDPCPPLSSPQQPRPSAGACCRGPCPAPHNHTSQPQSIRHELNSSPAGRTCASSYMLASRGCIRRSERRRLA